MPVPQRVNFLVEQAEKPVPKKLIENCNISALQAFSVVSCLRIHYTRMIGNIARRFKSAS